MDAYGKRKLDILRHALGLTRGDEMYRNHFVTGEGSVDYDVCKALVSDGMMTHRAGTELTGGDDLFLVTDEGKKYAIENAP